MELTEVLEAKMNLGQRQGEGKGCDFKCIGPRGAILMVLRVSSFPFSCPFFVPRVGTAIVEKTVKKLLFLLLKYLEQRSYSRS